MTILKTKGFTLTELMIVIAIIALLSSVVIGQVHKATVKAEWGNFDSELLQFKNAMEIYKNNHNGEYPDFTLVAAGPYDTLNNMVNVLYDEGLYSQSVIERPSEMIGDGNEVFVLPWNYDGTYSCGTTYDNDKQNVLMVFESVVVEYWKDSNVLKPLYVDDIEQTGASCMEY